MNESKSIACGAELTKATFDDFVARLRHHCRGQGVERHCTADALFVVQARRIVSGIDTQYTDQLMVYVDDASWFSPKDYWRDLDTHSRWELRRKAIEAEGSPFLLLREREQWDVLAGLDDHTVTGWDEDWEYVNAHFTREAAEAFIRRKKHDYQKGLRIYVDAQSYCWEFNAIKEALMDGKITFAEEA